ncbi:hypothetical protein [Actinoplanes sp. NPDC049265]|uniref:hypothetical protein n=1 Tax=Actinoplanes sp. NPDC049265 TaxID=3363902 RepID=UPI003720A984
MLTVEEQRDVRINVTITLPGRRRWLLAGIALGSLNLPDLLVQLAALAVRATGH